MTQSNTPPAPEVPARKKRSLGRLILRLFGVLLLLLVVGLLILFFSADSLVRAGVIRGGKYATDQETALQLAKLSFVGGSLNLNQLDIHNLEGKDYPYYKEPKFLSMKECVVSVDSGSILSNEVVINDITITGLEVWLETSLDGKGLHSNLNDLMAILQKKSPAADPKAGTAQASAPAESPGKKLRISHIALAGTKLHIRGIATMDLDLGPVEMKEPTNPDGRPMKIADVMTKVLLHVAQQIVENPQIPGNIKDGLKNVQALVDSLGKDLQKDLAGVGKNLKDVTKNLQDAGKDATKSLQDAGKNLQDSGKNIQNLLNPNKTTQPK